MTLQETRDFLQYLLKEYGKPEDYRKKLSEQPMPEREQERRAATTSQVPQKPIKSKFSPISIATSLDWMSFRGEVTDLNELENFLKTQRDSQSKQFLDIITYYKNDLNRNLVRPSEIDAETSYLFAEKLAEVIKKRLYVLLRSYRAGRYGKGVNSKEYYREIGRNMSIYFDRIGLKTFQLSIGDSFEKAQHHMEPKSTIPTKDDFRNKTIADIFVLPHYFDYYANDGEIKQFWIDGQCSVYTKS